MKRTMIALTLLTLTFAGTGCQHMQRKNCNSCNGPIGCRPCNLGWQRGGTDYQRFLGHSQHGAHVPDAQGNTGTAQVAYPYYTTRGPRDFLLNNPPTIGN